MSDHTTGKLTAGVKRSRTEEPDEVTSAQHPAERVRRVANTLPSIPSHGYTKYFIEKGFNKQYLEPIVTAHTDMNSAAARFFDVKATVPLTSHELQFAVIYRHIVYDNVLACLNNYVSRDMTVLFMAHLQAKTSAAPDALVAALNLDARIGTQFNKLYKKLSEKYEPFIKAAPKHQEQINKYLAKFTKAERRGFSKITKLVHMRVLGEIMKDNQLNYISQLFCNVLRIVDTIIKNPVYMGFIHYKHKELTGTPIATGSHGIFKPYILFTHSCVLKSMTWQMFMVDIVDQPMLTDITCANYMRKSVLNPYSSVLDKLSALTPEPLLHIYNYKKELSPSMVEYMILQADREALEPVSEPLPKIVLSASPTPTPKELDELEFLEGIDFDKELDLKTALELEAADEKAALEKAQAEYKKSKSASKKAGQ